MRAGRLDRKITIQRFVSGQDPNSGQVIETWTALAHRRWASQRSVRGDERFVAKQEVARQEVEFQIRYPASFLPSSLDRILYPAPQSGSEQNPPNDTIHDIVEVAEIGRRKGLKILTVRRTEHTQ